MKRSFAAGILLVTLGAAVVHAQTPRVVQAYRFGAYGPSRVERALRLHAALELTESQSSQLEAIRKEEVARRQNSTRDLIDLQSRAAAGQIDSDALRDEMRKLREGSDQSESSVRERIDRILTDQQQSRLDRELRFTAPAVWSRRVMPAMEPLLQRRAFQERYLRAVPRFRMPHQVRPPEGLRRQLEQIQQLRRRREGIL